MRKWQMLFASNKIQVSAFFLNVIRSLFELLFKNIRVIINRSFHKSHKSYKSYIVDVIPPFN